MKRSSRQPRQATRSGFTLVEVAVSSVVVAFLAMAASMAFSNNLRAVERAKGLSTSSIFAETVMEDLANVSYANLLALDGNRFFDVTDAADSSFAVDLTCFETALGLMQVEAVVTDLRTGRELGQITTLRADG